MSEPIRWRAPEGGASSEARDLLRHARAPRALDAAARARNAAAVTKIATGPVATTSAITAGTKALLGVGLASVMAVSVAVSGSRTRPSHDHRAPVAARTRGAQPPPQYVTTAPTPMPAPAPVETLAHAPPAVTPPVPARIATAEPRQVELAAPSPARHVAPVVALPSSPSPHVIPSLAAAPAAPTTPATPTTTNARTEAPSAGSSVAFAAGTGGHVTPGSATIEEDPLVRETRLFEGVGGLIERDPGAALAQLDRHGQEFPRGQLAAEREFFAVQALHRLGRDADARARGDALIARFPTSPYASRTRRLLDSLP
jgi:hypothetical protein